MGDDILEGLGGLWDGGFLAASALVVTVTTVALWAGLGILFSMRRIAFPILAFALRKCARMGNMDRAFKLARATEQSFAFRLTPRLLAAACDAVRRPRTVEAAPVDYRAAGAVQVTARQALLDVAASEVPRTIRRVRTIQVPVLAFGLLAIVSDVVAAAVGADSVPHGRPALLVLGAVALLVLAREAYVYLRTVAAIRAYVSELADMVAAPEFDDAARATNEDLIDRARRAG